jgi:aspartyl-tRNA(Asn)/glutamyl-tRNA(Gln) amidotransferase subunit A
MMQSLAFASIKTLRESLANKQISAEELLQYSINRFKTYDSKVGSALEVFDAESITKKSQPTGILAGIPGILKDNISQEGRALTCASKILTNFTAIYDATATSRLKEQGALLVGRSNMDEFAMGSSTETSAFQKTSNPWNLDCVPGGSGGGSVAAVAAGFVPWSLGSDTGGSVRQPSAFCGIVGMKPTYGLVSRYGLVAYGSSLDQIGVSTRTVYDNALVLSAIAGQDPKDSSTLAIAPQDYTKTLNGKLRDGLKIGIVGNAINASGMDSEVVAAIQEAVAVLQKLGAKVSNIDLPALDYSAAAYFIISRAEAASNLARFDGVRYGLRDKTAKTLAKMYFNTRHDGFGTEVKSRILIGNYVLSAGHAGDFYGNAKNVQRVIRQEFLDAFKEVDVLIMPTHPAPAFKFGAFDTDKLQMDLQDYFTCSMNLAGIPAISIPCGFTQSKMPIGFQIVGPHLSEDLIFQTAYAYEQATAWHTMHPAMFVD